MTDLINVNNRNGELVVSSREVATNFGKRHNDVVRAIEGKIKNLTTQNCVVEKYFIPAVFMHKGNTYDKYLLTRDGFSFIVMGFTGAKADKWKLKYIEAFNRMEEQIKQQIITTDLSPELQVLINMELKQRELETAVTETKEEMANIKETFGERDENWRKWTNERMKAIGSVVGDYRKPRNESYTELESRARCNLDRRLVNLRKNMKEAGVGKTTRQKANYLDVIEQDTRLKEIYISIVKEMAVKYL